MFGRHVSYSRILGLEFVVVLVGLINSINASKNFKKSQKSLDWKGGLGKVKGIVSWHEPSCFSSLSFFCRVRHMFIPRARIRALFDL